MPKIIFHTKEYFLTYQNSSSILLKIITKFKNGYYIDYDHIWLPRSHIESDEKRYLNEKTGEFIVIYELPAWLIESKNLWNYHYDSQLELKRHVEYLNKQR